METILRKYYISDEEINQLSRQANEIVSTSKVSKVRSICSKYDLNPDRPIQEIRQAFWLKFGKELKELPTGDKFRTYLEEERRWKDCAMHANIVREYIQHKKAWTDFEILSEPVWAELESFLSQIRDYGVEATGSKTFISLGGDLSKYLNQWSKKNCDKQALATSAKFFKAVSPLIKDLDPMEAGRIGKALFGFCMLPQEERTEDNFHNLLYRD